jgi:hypothetical protein
MCWIPMLTGCSLYCSPATKEILLRLEKYDARMNLHRGILEAPKVTYKHLKDRLVRGNYPHCFLALSPQQKTIPLETPTVIELAPRNEIQATMFDANHCTGAVMFCKVCPHVIYCPANAKHSD